MQPNVSFNAIICLPINYIVVLKTGNSIIIWYEIFFAPNFENKIIFCPQSRTQCRAGSLIAENGLRQQRYGAIFRTHPPPHEKHVDMWIIGCVNYVWIKSAKWHKCDNIYLFFNKSGSLKARYLVKNQQYFLNSTGKSSSKRSNSV